MIEYAYIHPQPLHKAQRYDFASCADYGFIEGWKAFRKASRRKFQTVAPHQQTSLEESANDIPEAIAVNDLMGTERGLWLLIKKFEVFGRIYAFYQADGRSHPQSGAAPLLSYVAFADALLQWAREGECYQYHSTLLKVVDALCVLPVVMVDAQIAENIVRVIDEEQELIDQLGAVIYGT